MKPVLADQGIEKSMWDDFSAGKRLACSRLISYAENDANVIAEIRDRIIPLQKGAPRIGITGPPGVGKSTVSAALAKAIRRNGDSVGIIAVDPSSPFTGGAFLGDRVRMNGLAGDDKIFIRSLASRDGKGGLSPATPLVADIFDAFGMDWVLIETIGVGQAELDVLNCADIVVMVMQPSTGDVIQALKAGIMEVGDIFLINKSDLPGSDLLKDTLLFILQMNQHRNETSIPPILSCIANEDKGIEELLFHITQKLSKLKESGGYYLKQKSRLKQEIKDTVIKHLWEEFSGITQADERISAVAEKLALQPGSPYPFIENLLREVTILKKSDFKPINSEGDET